MTEKDIDILLRIKGHLIVIKEAEKISATSVACEVICIKRILNDLQFEQRSPTVIVKDIR